MNFKIFQQTLLSQSINLPQNQSQVTIVCRIKKPRFARNQTQSKRSQSSSSQHRRSNSKQAPSKIRIAERATQLYRSSSSAHQSLTKSEKRNYSSGFHQINQMTRKQTIRTHNNPTLNSSASNLQQNLGAYGTVEQTINTPRSVHSVSQISVQNTNNNTQKLLCTDLHLNQVNLTIFSTSNESQHVLCTPPVNSSQTGINAKYLKENLVTEEDMPSALNNVGQELQVYTFDKIINDTYAENGGIERLYNTVIRPKITQSIQFQTDRQRNRCVTVLMFGPNLVNQKLRKESPLLCQLPDYNMALRCCSDLLKNPDQVCYISIFQIYQNSVDDLLRSCMQNENQAQSNIYQPVRSIKDFNLVLRVAQLNRESLAQRTGVLIEQLKRKSHLVVRVTPECPTNLDSVCYEFVELCGSDLAATMEVASETREAERDRNFASTSFNNLSKSLISIALQQQTSTDQNCQLTSLIQLQGKVIFCCNLQACAVSKDLRHNLTAMKFTTKIRDAIIKRQQKRNSKLRSQLEQSMNNSINEVESELGNIRSRLQYCQQNGDVQTTQRFWEVLDKYEQKVSMFKMTGSQFLESSDNDRVHEFEKMRSDITTLRKKLEGEQDVTQNNSTLGINDSTKGIHQKNIPRHKASPTPFFMSKKTSNAEQQDEPLFQNHKEQVSCKSNTLVTLPEAYSLRPSHEIVQTEPNETNGNFLLSNKQAQLQLLHLGCPQSSNESGSDEQPTPSKSEGELIRKQMEQFQQAHIQEILSLRAQLQQKTQRENAAVESLEHYLAELKELHNYVQEVQQENQVLRQNLQQALEHNEYLINQAAQNDLPETDHYNEVAQLQLQLKLALKEKQVAINNFDASRVQLQAMHREKFDVEENFNKVQTNELERLNELEGKFMQISEQYLRAKEELVKMKRAEALNNSSSLNQSNRDYKERYLDMREINKDLKKHFRELEDKLTQFLKENPTLTVELVDSESNKENQRRSNRQNLMLADISAMITEYKKKQKYDSVLTNMANPHIQSVDSPQKKIPANTISFANATINPYDGAIYGEK